MIGAVRDQGAIGRGPAVVSFTRHNLDDDIKQRLRALAAAAEPVETAFGGAHNCATRRMSRCSRWITTRVGSAPVR